MRFSDEEVGMSQFPEFLLYGDTLQISCAVNYSGSLAPDFVWFPTPDDTPSLDDTSSSVKSTINSRSRAKQRYTCYVRFSGSIFSSAGNRTSRQVTG